MNHRACLSCRARKVRCDVAFSRDACTNCVLDSKKCVVHWRRRHDYRYGQLVEFRYGSFVSCVPLPNLHLQIRNRIDKPDAPEAETKAVMKPLPAPKQDEDAATVLTEECLGAPKLAEARPRQSPSYDHTQARPEITFAYYPFLCINNLNSLRTDDINYLESQGCLRVPESSCLDDLVRAFFRYAHPILPVVNEAEFWSIYDPLTSGSRASRIPVILLSAMLFVACKVSPTIYTGKGLG